MSIRSVLFVGLAALGALIVVHWWRARPVGDANGTRSGVGPLDLLIGFGTNFFDTLGIGSFAPTTSIFKLTRRVPDERIPGTMHVGHTPPVIAQAFIFIAIVEVNPVTLLTLVGASVVGAWLGAGVVAQWPRRNIQIGMGIALLLAAATFVLTIYGLLPAGGTARGLSGPGLIGAAAGIFVLGALMTLGIGMYAPSMIMISLLGMNPVTAFPIMMGASAFLMPVAGVRFLSARRFSHGPALGLALGGLPAVLVAAFLVRSLPLSAMRWLVVVVVLYAAVAMLRSAIRESRTPSATERAA